MRAGGDSPRWVVAALWLALAGSSVAASEPGMHFVRVPAQAFAGASKLGPHAGPALDYRSFVWTELTDADLARLHTAGIEYEVRPDAFALRLAEQSFDPRVGRPIVPPGWDAAEAPGRGSGADLHLVQFAGPARAEWIQSLQARGLQVVQYIAPFTYVVWGPAEARDNLRAAPGVRWTGGFAPAYRVHPKWWNLPGRPQQVKVLLYRGADTAAAVRAIQALGGTFQDERNLNEVFKAAGFTLPGGAMQAAAGVPGVYSIQLVPTDGGLRGEMSDQVCVNNVDEDNLAFPGYQDWLAGVGLNGSGVTIANVDAGIQNTHPDLVNNLIGCTGTTCGGSTSSTHGTHTAGIMAADGASGTTDSFGFLRGLGMAPGASLVEQLYSPTHSQPGGMLLLMTQSFNNGASLSGNSWGPAGTPMGYDDDTLQVDIGVRDADPDAPGNQPLTYVLSIMNGYGGTSTQGTPDEAKNIFTIGSTKMQLSSGTQIPGINDLSINTAHGPALDGRKIPHMVAPGRYVDSTSTGSGYALLAGTSMASPHVSGAVALFIEYYRNLGARTGDPSPALIKAAFLPVAKDLAGNDDADGGTLGHPFDSKQGWGRLHAEAVLDPQVEVAYFDSPFIFDDTGEEWSVNVTVADPAKELRVMLVWTDAPGHGLGGSTPAWNNDLDLVVEIGGSTYRGNNFGSDGWSATGGTADFKNNTEGVFVGPTASGPAAIRVIAANIGSDAIPSVGDATDQDFALVCYNCRQDLDCNTNGINDDQDIAAGTSGDCNSNGVPDECEPFADCNTNGVADICDIAGGTSGDCNADGVPDDCQSRPDCNNNGTFDECEDLPDCNADGVPDECTPDLDCNTNGILDECETLPDCNNNRIPDSCDIVAGTSQDCDENGVPDECQTIGTLLSADFEGGVPTGWSATGLWHTTGDCPQTGACDPVTWAYYGQDGDCDFDAGDTSGALTAPPVVLPADAPATLTYCSVYRGESGNSNNNGYDWAWVEVNGLEADDVSLDGDRFSWETRVVDLSVYAGETVNISWRFDSVDGISNNELGWQIDDVILTGGGSFDDCNTNGQLDACDIDQQISPDCNGNAIPDECETIPRGDYDDDGDTDLSDFISFNDCAAGPDDPPAPSAPACTEACLNGFDYDGDGDVDAEDFAAFQNDFTG